MKKRKIMIITAIALVIVIVSGAVIWKMLGIRAEGESTQIDTSKWDTVNRVNIVNDTEGIPVPVPKGYTASSIDGEHTVNNGFVIYEGEEAVTEENKDSAQKTRNQWVWVPVENMSDIYFTDSNGEKNGQLWYFNSTEREKRNSSSYSVSKEPLVPEGSYIYLPYLLAEEDESTLNLELQEEFENVIYSIEKYGGFYIGRYETGDLSKQKAKVVKGNEDIYSQNWYRVYRKSKEILQNKNGNAITSMIWGCLWDQTLNWIVTTGNKTYSDIYNSKSWGNYNTNHTNKTAKPTGFSERWKANNIYDMAGNIHEATLEISKSQYVARGSDYGTYGEWTVSRRISLWPETKSDSVRYTCNTIYKIVRPNNGL